MKSTYKFSFYLTLVALLVASTALFAQTGDVAGTVSSRAGDAIIGANVVIEGTTLGAATDADGGFIISGVPVGTQNVVVSMIGYERYVTAVTVVENRRLSIEVALTSTTIALSDVVIKGNIAKARETPVAFTDVGEDHIRKSFNVQDVPHLFANTPGVYITSDGGSGMGDSKVMIRGFDEQRIAVMINNVPVNDPESKKVYWSNWGSLPAASKSIQVQRGVGSSLYGSGALGGSINVITKDAPAAQSLGLTFTGGQYGIFKAGVDYNSGLTDDNFAFIGRVNYMEGNGWRQDTYYQGIQYYLSGMWFPNEKNTIKIILHGAPQYHAYSYYGFPAKDFAKYGRDWNGHPHIAESDLTSNAGAYADRNTTLGDVFFMRYEIGANPMFQKGGVSIGNDRASFDNNVYHKPQFEIHHSLRMNNITSLTTTFFMSKGYGYGENINGYYKINRQDDGNITWADIMSVNSSSFYQYRAYSDHFQTGILSSLDTKLFGVHDFTAGVELRWWKARHAGEILNTFKRDKISYYIGNVKQEFSAGDLYYDYTTTKPQATAFAHALWRFGDLSVMTDIQVSYLKYYINEDVPSSNNYPTGEDHGGNTWVGTGNAVYSLWDYERDWTYVSPKIGVNYNVNDNINVFANWSRAVNEPRVKYFFGYGSPNELLDLEETSDIELGAAYMGELAGMYFDLKYNFYNIQFQGKSLRVTDPTMANTPGYDYKGRRYLPIGESTYQGHEVAFNVDLMKGLTVGFNASFADNLWGEPSSAEGAQYLYSNDDVVAGVDYTDADGDGKWDAGEVPLHSDFVGKFGEKVEVGMPQTILGATLNYTIGDFWLGGAFRYFSDIYVLENNAPVTVEGHLEADGSWVSDTESQTLPSASVIDVRFGFDFKKLTGVPLYMNVHIANILNEEYWQKGDNYGFLPGAERTLIVNAGITL